MTECNCWFCQSAMHHPEDHTDWHDIDESHEACVTCGHKRDKQ